LQWLLLSHSLVAHNCNELPSNLLALAAPVSGSQSFDLILKSGAQPNPFKNGLKVERSENIKVGNSSKFFYSHKDQVVQKLCI